MTAIMDWLESEIDADLRDQALAYIDAERRVEAEAFWIAACRHDPDLETIFTPEYQGETWIGNAMDLTRCDLYCVRSSDYMPAFNPEIDPMGSLEDYR